MLHRRVGAVCRISDAHHLTVEALKSHAEDLDVTHEALVAIMSLCDSAESSDKIGAHGGCEVVVHALRRHKGRQNIVEAACNAIACLAAASKASKARLLE